MTDALSSHRQHQLVLSGTGPHPGYLDDFDAVIVEILSWLPVKSLLRFRCACKAWRLLISESYFINKHLARTKSKCSFNLLVKDKSSFQSIEYQAALNCASHEDAIPSRELHSPFAAFEDPHVTMIGSCNGLVCMFLDRFDTPTVMIWNPCTRDSQVLPTPPVIPKNVKYFGFGYDFTSDDYKVVIGGWSYDVERLETFVVVFTLKSGSWRKLDSPKKRFRAVARGNLVNGALHWGLYEYKHVYPYASRIGSFDLAEEKFHEISFPYPVDGSILSAQVGILDHCLCLTLYFKTRRYPYEHVFQMWVMKDYGIKESWTEVINTPSGIPAGKNQVSTCFYIETLVSPLIGGTIGAGV